MKRETRLLTVRRGAGSTSAGITAGDDLIVSEPPEAGKDLQDR
jgi:hypothetical protein